MTLSKEALIQLQESAHIPELLSQLKDVHFPAALLPEHFKIESLERLQAYRNNFRAKFATAHTESYVEYLKAFSDSNSQCHINAEQMCANTVLDVGTIEAPLHGMHRASLKMDKSGDFSALLQIHNDRLNQKQLADWIEDFENNCRIIAVDDTEMSIAQASSAIRHMKFERKMGRESSIGDFSATQSEYDSIAAKTAGELPTPAIIQFTCEPYHGLKERTFEVRISTLSSECFCLRIRKLEQHAEEMAEEFKDCVLAALKQADIQIKTFIGDINF